MKYALVNDKIHVAQPGLSGKCKYCGCKTVSKCGNVKIWHWAHSGKRMCDPWWENETEWHRTWKEQFPKECQEVIQYAENGEKHIADVKMEQGYVIEFQHSIIKTEERQAREDFYKKMLWIVDGTRRLRDKRKFEEILENPHSVYGTEDVLRPHAYHDECPLIRDWLESNVPVFFDFNEDILWGLMPESNERKYYVCKVERNTLINSLCSNEQTNGFETLMNDFTKSISYDERYWRWLKLKKIEPYQLRLDPRTGYKVMIRTEVSKKELDTLP